ncbi:MAG TPA: hypothetical protein VK524_17685, partial [Polyangiaceae bacterium]|nr:hypothetical protein [Polyangiaceae bacterium]
MKLTRSDLIALARKYEILAELRRAQYHMSFVEARAPLRRLAREFPGALRELDLLPLDEIDRRADALRAAAQTGETAPWMEWLHEYHSRLRLALSVKRQLPGRRALDDGTARQMAETLGAEHGCVCDAAFVQAVLRPP